MYGREKREFEIPQVALDTGCWAKYVAGKLMCPSLPTGFCPVWPDVTNETSSLSP